MEALCVPIPPEAEESTPTDITSNEQEDQILLEVGAHGVIQHVCM